MSKAVVFFADGTEECEALLVVDLLRRAKVEVIVASAMGRRELVRSHNIHLTADALAAEVDYSDVDMVVLPGGIGTYEELFEMLTLKQLGRTDRAIVLLNTEGYFEPLFELLRHTARERFMSHRCLELFSVAETPEEALSQLDAYTPTKGSLRRLADYNKD